MTGSSAEDAAERVAFAGLKGRLYGLAFIDEFGPIYAVYTLWFNDNGISTARLSTVFIVWAVVALALEIPSGALADRIDRRRLLGAAFTIRGAGIALWLVWPTFTGVLIGASLWALHDALASGAWEAMIHDELDEVGQARSYATVMARIGQFSHLGIAASTLLGAALLRIDVGLETLGWLTLAAHAGSIALVVTLPEVRWRGAADEGTVRPATADAPDSPSDRSIGAGPVAETILPDLTADDTFSYRAWWSTLRTGVRDARSDPLIARLVAVGAMLEGLFIVDEYVPLIVRARGGTDATAPIVVFVVWVGLLVGGEIAARRPTLSGRWLGGALIGGVAVMAVAFATSSVWTLMLVALGYAALQALWVASDARLQEHTPAATRATVTSVRGFGSATISMLAFVAIGAMSDGDDPTRGQFVVLTALAVAGVLAVRWLPPPAEMES